MASSQTWNFEADTSVFNSVDISNIAGNAPAAVKHIVGCPQTFCEVYRAKGMAHGYGEEVQNRMRVTEVSVNKKAEEPSKVEGRMVMELEVHEDMLNPGACLHGGCCAYLIDICSTFVLMATKLSTGAPLTDNVSQSINIMYHSPALLGDKLRIVNTTQAMGAKTNSMKTEIWNVTRKRLVVTGIHLKMTIPREPSSKKASL